MVPDPVELSWNDPKVYLYDAFSYNNNKYYMYSTVLLYKIILLNTFNHLTRGWAMCEDDLYKKYNETRGGIF